MNTNTVNLLTSVFKFHLRTLKPNRLDWQWSLLIYNQFAWPRFLSYPEIAWWFCQAALVGDNSKTVNYTSAIANWKYSNWKVWQSFYRNMNHTKFEDQTDIISQALNYKTANYFDLIYLRLSLAKSSLQKVQYILVFIAFNKIHVVVILSFVLFL